MVGIEKSLGHFMIGRVIAKQIYKYKGIFIRYTFMYIPTVAIMPVSRWQLGGDLISKLSRWSKGVYACDDGSCCPGSSMESNLKIGKND